MDVIHIWAAERDFWRATAWATFRALLVLLPKLSAVVFASRGERDFATFLSVSGMAGMLRGGRRCDNMALWLVQVYDWFFYAIEREITERGRERRRA